MNKGSYLLILNLPKSTVLKYGKNSREFQKGFYIYVGSAMNSLTGRIGYHLSNDKKGKWHIDKLLSFAAIEYIVMIPSGRKFEEEISNSFEKERDLEVIEGFGSSDIKSKGNLFFVKSEGFFKRIFEVLEEVRKT